MTDMNKEMNAGPRLYFLIHAGFSTAFTYLTSGVFLSGLAILIGAGDVLVSYLSIIVNICGVLILLFATFLERFPSRKKLTITLTILSRLMTLFIVVIPAVVSEGMQLILFIPAVIVAFTLQAQTTVVLNQWMLEFMDEKRRGQYISLRQTLALIVTVILSLTSGYLMDYMKGEYNGFIILFSIAAAMGIGEIVLLCRTPDSRKNTSSITDCKWRDIIKVPLKDRCFTLFVLYILVFYMLLYISDSFTMVYMMRYLALPYGTVNILYMIISLPQIFLLSIWGKISDRWGHGFALTTSIWLFAGETLFMFMTSGKNWYIFIPVAFFIASIANAGFVVAVFNRRYELMPAGNRIVYDNFYTAAIGLGFILGPMIGGAIKSRLESAGLWADSMPFAGIRILYLFSTAGILLLQIIYLCVQRKGGKNIAEN